MKHSNIETSKTSKHVLQLPVPNFSFLLSAFSAGVPSLPVGRVPSRGSPLIPFLPFPLSRTPQLSQVKLNQAKLSQKIIFSGKQVRKFAPRPSPSPKPIRLCVRPPWQLNYG